MDTKTKNKWILESARRATRARAQVRYMNSPRPRKATVDILDLWAALASLTFISVVIFI